MSLINEFSRMKYIYFLKKNSKVFESFLKFKALVENQTDRKIKVLKLIVEEISVERSSTSCVNITI